MGVENDSLDSCGQLIVMYGHFSAIKLRCVTSILINVFSVLRDVLVYGTFLEYISKRKCFFIMTFRLIKINKNKRGYQCYFVL